MSSDSDDEPLSNLAKTQRLTKLENDSENELSDTKVKKQKIKKKKKRIKQKELTITLPASKINDIIYPDTIQRPIDVWLYLKDLSATGPYSCLLCAEWFINKSKIVIHYILNHKKDYCGICRYFVPDQEAWENHKTFHIPWHCSRCPAQFQSEKQLREHFSLKHQSVHCKLCNFMLSDNEDYHIHLFQKHNVTNVSVRNEDVFWEIEYEGSPKFHCLLCSKSDILVIDYFRHFICYHRFTLKCFTALLSGYEVPFSVYGANISPGFLASQLTDQTNIGYKELEQPEVEEEQKTLIAEEANTNLLNALIPEIKQEVTSDAEETKDDCEDEATNSMIEELLQYKGEENFDVTLTEIVILQNFYYDYIESVLKAIDSNVVHTQSKIDYKAINLAEISVTCSICSESNLILTDLVMHMNKMHCLRLVPFFSCRVCGLMFETEVDYSNHVLDETNQFEDLWLCQFCDKEFESRETTREHLTQHWGSMDSDNCFSPHLGFKCRYCPMLFWSELEREIHHNDIHHNNHMRDFYKCSLCDNVFSDKVWYTHHYYKHHKDSHKVPAYFIKCSICCLVLPKMEDMKIHFKIDHPEATKIFCCLDPCKFRPLGTNKSFKVHLKTMHCRKNDPSQNPPLVYCTVCGREFTNAKACGTHMALAHGPGRFKCKFCSESMQSADERKLHYLIRHPGQYHFDCTICGKSFQYKSSLYIHRANEHTTKKVTYTCSFCNKEFSKRDSYREHLQIHEGPRHACSYCPMRFVQRSNMLRHERRHTGERPYNCTHCPRTFADKGACNSHMRTHSRDAVFSCVYCAQTFVQKSKLKYHLRKHTGEDLETCPICSKLFTSTYSLKEHLKTHERKVGATCPICNKLYSDERSTIRHIKRMHSEKPPSCPLCGKLLTTIEGLRQHVLTHSKLKQFECRLCSKEYSMKKSMVKHLRKRHSVKEKCFKPYYKQLNARECQLGLDENVMDSIFGKPRHSGADVIIEDFVTFPNKNLIQKLTESVTNKDDDSDDVDENDDDDNGTDDSSSGGGGAEMESVNQIEPPSFVSIKVEPMDDDYE